MKRRVGLPKAEEVLVALESTVNRELQLVANVARRSSDDPIRITCNIPTAYLQVAIEYFTTKPEPGERFSAADFERNKAGKREIILTGNPFAAQIFRQAAVEAKALVYRYINNRIDPPANGGASKAAQLRNDGFEVDVPLEEKAIPYLVELLTNDKWENVEVRPSPSQPGCMTVHMSLPQVLPQTEKK